MFRSACRAAAIVGLWVTAVSGASAQCVGDCDANGWVGVSELITGVGIALDRESVAQCPAFDADADADVSIAELTTAVTFALTGCPPTPMATATPVGCGDAAVIQRFNRCRRADTEEACVDLGGTWGPYAYSRRLGCHCFTGDGGCRCSRDSDCVGRCYTQTGAPFGLCDGVTEGLCSVREPLAGCWCQAFLDQGFVGFCNDP